MECTLWASDNNDLKYCNIKEFVKAAREYSLTKTEESFNSINRYLQLLSVTIDYSTFDPDNSLVSEFFICLHDLVTSLEARSSLIWCCISVLKVICNNPSARQKLIHTYEFVPSLSRLVGDHLAHDKKIKLLTLMQELTCGIKISWQIPHLPHLMLTLTKWIEHDDEDVIVLSLGVLVNLCYKNLPAVYTLSRCTDIKKFLKICISKTTPRIEMYICKLLIVLEHIHGGIEDSVLRKMIDVTFKTIADTVISGDSVYLRHIVDFFMDIYNQKEHRNKLLMFDNYYSEVERLLQIIENNFDHASPSGDKQLHPECVSIVFEFLFVIIEMKIKEFTPLYSKIIAIALKWVHTESVCTQAILILRTIAVNIDHTEYVILEPFSTAIPLFMLDLASNLENVENVKRLAAVMNLFQVLVQIHPFNDKILEHLNEELVTKIFNSLLENKCATSEEATHLQIYTLSLMNRLAVGNERWSRYLKMTLNQKPIYAILARGLLNGVQHIKLLVLQITQSEFFSTDTFSMALSELQVIADAKAPDAYNLQHCVSENMLYPILSVGQSERLEELLSKLRYACMQNNFSSVATSDVVELFEYKIASLSHSELIAMNNAEAASQRCTHLQRRIAQLSAELKRSNQMLLHKQQQHETLVSEREEYIKKHVEFSNKVEAEKRLNQTLKRNSVLKQNQIDEQEQLIGEQKSHITKLESNIAIAEGQLKKKEELLNKLNVANDGLQVQIQELKKTIQTIGDELAAKSKELEVKNNIVAEITKLATRKH